MLRLDEIHFEMVWFFEGFFDGGFGDFVEDDAFCLFWILLKNMGDMPCDCFSFAVSVRCEVNFCGVFCGFFEGGYFWLFIFWDNVGWFEAVFDIYAHVFFGEVADVAKRRNDCVAFSEDFFDGLCLCGRLYDEEFGHNAVDNAAICLWLSNREAGIGCYYIMFGDPI